MILINIKSVGIMNIKKWLQINTESLKGKRVAVTGSTGGIGRELCSYLGFFGASLVLLDRNFERSQAHKQSLCERFGDIEVTCIELNLEELDSAENAVKRLKELEIDVFIHNAGAYSIPRRKCESGYDNVFQINFATPYYMINELLPILRKRKGRVVAVGSIAHNYSKTDPCDIDFSSRKASSKVYGNAKRYLMFSLYELFKNEKEASLAITHPGITLTNITAHYPKLIFAVIKHPMKIIFMKPKKASLSVLKGVFEATEYCRWIGPSIFDVWGMPKSKKLKTCNEDERNKISHTANNVYMQCKKTINNKGEQL